MNKKNIIERFDLRGVDYEMEKRIENFQAAMKNPTKRLTPDPSVKHDVYNVDTQGFNPDVKISVDEDETTIEENSSDPKS
jgi:hypothetical protein